MTTIAVLETRATDRERARWMPLTSDELGVLADMAKCVSVVEDMLIVVRVSQELHDALERDADANERTVAQSVRFHLRKALT